MQLVKLLLRHLTGCAHHDILRVLVHRLSLIHIWMCIRDSYIWDLTLFSETQEKSGGPVCGTCTLWVNGKTTLDEEIQALEALDGVSYMTLM